MSYYVALRGTLEKFGLYPQGENHANKVSQAASKLNGGTLEVTSPDSSIYGAKIVVPADPYPGEPGNYTYLTATAVSDPADTRESLWEDTILSISHRTNPPTMAQPCSGRPGCPFRSVPQYLFNRDVTITIPYDPAHVSSDGNPKPYVFNHLTNAWEAIEPTEIDAVSGRITFKTQVLGLFQVGGKENRRPSRANRRGRLWQPARGRCCPRPRKTRYILMLTTPCCGRSAMILPLVLETCTHSAEYQAVGDSTWTAHRRYRQCGQGICIPRAAGREPAECNNICLPVLSDRLRFADFAVPNLLFPGSNNGCPAGNQLRPVCGSGCVAGIGNVIIAGHSA